MTKTLSLASLISSAFLLNQVTYDLKLLSSHCLMFSLPSHAKVRPSLIYIKTKSSGALSKVKLVIRPAGVLTFVCPFFRLSWLPFFLSLDRYSHASLASSVHSFYRSRHPQRSYTSWLGIACEPWSSGHSCKLRIRTFQIEVRW